MGKPASGKPLGANSEEEAWQFQMTAANGIYRDLGRLRWDCSLTGELFRRSL